MDVGRESVIVFNGTYTYHPEDAHLIKVLALGSTQVEEARARSKYRSVWEDTYTADYESKDKPREMP